MSLDLFYDDVVIVSQMLYGISYNGAITGEGFRIIPWQKVNHKQCQRVQTTCEPIIKNGPCWPRNRSTNTRNRCKIHPSVKGFETRTWNLLYSKIKDRVKIIQLYRVLTTVRAQCTYDYWILELSRPPHWRTEQVFTWWRNQIRFPKLRSLFGKPDDRQTPEKANPLL